MIRVSLRFFASRVLKTKRMDKGDRRTLERVIFSDGVRSRVEAEILLQLARTIRESDSAWTDFVVAAVVDFAVWGSRPTGYVDPDMADWLIAVLTEGGATALTRRIARDIVKEAHGVDRRFTDFIRPWWLPRLPWAAWSRTPAQRSWAPA